MIEVTSLTKRFGEINAVTDLSFSIKVGELVGFLGPNGAGKTTTMRLLLGYLTPTTGSVKINGINPSVDRTGVLKKIGYLPENNPLYGEMRVREYLRFIGDVRHKKVTPSLIEEIGLGDVLEKKIEELSRGYRQRVGLASALLADPEILFLDEPTSGLDPLEQDKIKELIRRISKKKTILFSTHILSEVEDMATRLLIIHKGKIAYDGKKPKAKGAVTILFKKLVRS